VVKRKPEHGGKKRRKLLYLLEKSGNLLKKASQEPIVNEEKGEGIHRGKKREETLCIGRGPQSNTKKSNTLI